MRNIEQTLQRLFTYTLYILLFSIMVLVGIGGALFLIQVTSPKSASAITYGSSQLSSNSIYVDKKYEGTNGVGNYIQDRVNVSAGNTVTVNLYYRNEGRYAVSNARIQDSLPAGFTYQAGSLKNCTIPTAAEQECFTLSDSLFSGSNLTVSPSAGTYGANLTSANGGTTTNSTYGYLTAGRKKYLSLHQCAYYFYAEDSYFINHLDYSGTNSSPYDVFDAPTRVANEALSADQCEAGQPGTWFEKVAVNSGVANIDLRNNRYLNLHHCAYYNSTLDTWYHNYINLNTLYDGFSNASNTADTTETCDAGLTGGYVYQAFGSGTQAVDLFAKRYLNLHMCTYTASSPVFKHYSTISNVDITDYNTGTNASLVNPDTSYVCGAGNVAYAPNTVWRKVTALDLSEPNRALGLIQYKMTAPTTAGKYGTSVTLSAQSASGSNYITSSAVDSYIANGENEIEVVTASQYSLGGGVSILNSSGNEVNSRTIENGKTYTVRARYANNGYGDLTGAYMNISVPSGFTINNSSFKNCLTPSSAETVCTGTTTPTGTVISGNTITISPSWRLYDQGTDTSTIIGSSASSTSGMLPIGKKRYAATLRCVPNTTESPTTEASYFHFDNVASSIFTEPCSPNSTVLNPPPYPYTSFTQYNSINDLKNIRYMLLYKCSSSKNLGSFIDYRQVEIVSYTSTYASPATIQSSASAACNANTDVGVSSGYTVTTATGSLHDMLGSRFLNRLYCISGSKTTADVIADDMIPFSGSSFFDDGPTSATNVCSNQATVKTGTAGGNTHDDKYARYDSFDMLDVSRSGGYIEFTITAPSNMTTFTNYSINYTADTNETAALGNSATLTYDPAIFTGTAYRDVNGNNLYDAGTDSALSGVQVTLTTNLDTYVQTTDANGNYSFNVAEPSQYTLAITSSPTGYVLVTPNVGANDAIDSDFDNNTGVLVGAPYFIVPPTTVNVDYDAIFSFPVNLEVTSISSGGGSSVTATKGTVYRGNAIYYDITVKNLGTSLNPTNGTISFTSTYPSADLTYVSYSAPLGWTCSHSTGSLSCSTTNVLGGGDTAVIRFNFTVKQ